MRRPGLAPTAVLAAALLGALAPGVAPADEPGVAADAGAGDARVALPVAVATERVTVRAEAGLERPAARLARGAARHLARIEADLLGLPRVERVEVRLVKHAADLSAVAPPGRGAPPWAAGVAWPSHGVLAVAARGRDGALIDLDRTLAHELAHLALGRALGPGRVPRWLTEGFANLHSSDFSLERAVVLAGAAFRNALIPLRELDDAFPLREDEVALAYAQSYDFVVFLARRGRWSDDRDDGSRAAFHQFLAELGGGRALDEAAVRAFGRPLATLEAEWVESVRARYVWFPLGAAATLVWVLGGALLFAAWLRRTVQKRRRLRQWAREEAGEEPAGPGGPAGRGVDTGPHP